MLGISNEDIIRVEKKEPTNADAAAETKAKIAAE
jgi:hypothetical protein